MSLLSDFQAMLAVKADAIDENNHPSTSQARELLTTGGGWDAIGYLMMSKELVDGKPFGRKRVISKSAASGDIEGFEGWFQSLIKQGYVACWRFYLSKGGGCDVRDHEFKGVIVYRKTIKSISTYEVIVEFMLRFDGAEFAKKVSKADWKEIAKATSVAMGVPGVASEFAMMASLAAKGATTGWYNSADK